MKSLPRYNIISPIKDEARYVELTLESVTQQTVKPALWIIVDDGSSDATPSIVQRYADRHSFIRVLSSRTAGARALGSAEAHAFKIGYASLAGADYEYIVKLDGDLSFEPDYFERLLTRFTADDRLGIGSGIYLEVDDAGTWQPVNMPAYHAFGACKVVRRECFEAIGGFLTTPGWDTVDEIRARTRGWKTAHFSDLQVKHHKQEGSAMGALPTSVFHGRIYYLTGGDPFFLIFKVLHRMRSRPFVVSGVALAFGYMKALLTRPPRLVTAAEARCYRQLLWQRLRSGS